MSFKFIRQLPAPEEIKEQYPVPEHLVKLKADRDAMIADVFTGKSDKFIVIVGPCSADNEPALLDYVERRKFDISNGCRPVMVLFFCKIIILCIAYMRIYVIINVS